MQASRKVGNLDACVWNAITFNGQAQNSIGVL